MTNETKAKIIEGLSEYSGAFGKSYVVSITGPSKDFVPMELITNPEWAKGVWGEKLINRDTPAYIWWVVYLVRLHLQGKDSEVWDGLSGRWEEVR